MSSDKTALKDTFVQDNLPPESEWPELILEVPEVNYPECLNAAVRLLAQDKDRVAIRADGLAWTYGQVDEISNRVARVLVEDMGLESGNRVLLRAPNSPMMAAAWLAVLKAGGVVVATMPLLRSVELLKVIEKGQVSHALCDVRMMEEMRKAESKSNTLRHIMTFEGGELEGRMKNKPADFEAVKTFSHDPALLAFTSGTTGKPKACIHFHRDVMAMADTFSRYILKPEGDEVFSGTPPLSFTFGLGGLLAFPFAVGASTVLNSAKGIEAVAADIEKFNVTTLFTSPTAYRALLGFVDQYDFASLKKCVSAGETLSEATSNAWFEATGVRPIDGIGSTEMIHIFISASGDDIRPGATGKAVPGFRAVVLDDTYQPLPPGSTGFLGVKGPTGCRYLDDERQKGYVKGGWNVTGDVFHQDDDGYFWFKARSDDMIVSGGYNISGPEVEDSLLAHEAVFECAVVASPDDKRGSIVKAFVVLNNGAAIGDDMVKALQEHVKATIAPYKYPRMIEFVEALPKTETGKIQRFKLRQQETGEI